MVDHNIYKKQYWDRDKFEIGQTLISKSDTELIYLARTRELIFEE